MTKIDALRRFLLPCFSPSSPAPPSTTTTPRKRLSTSLRDPTRPPRAAPALHAPTSPSSPSSDGSTPHAPPRPSKSMVVGTIFGRRRRGHVFLCIQQDRLSARHVSLLLELSIPIALLVSEMRSGLVRLALECDRPELAACPLRRVPVWTLFCNGRRAGFAVRRRPSAAVRHLLRTMRSVSVGAGVIPAVTGKEGEVADEEEEVMYMRANYECVVGSADSESFHLINPDRGPGQELSFFLLRTR